MLPPNQDITARQPIWDAMQMLWMDVDPDYEIPGIAKICAQSEYSLSELQAIFLNEVRPAVSFNLRYTVTPEWKGFNLDWLTGRILATHKFGKPLPSRWFHRHVYKSWKSLEIAIKLERTADSEG
ncbi:DUF7079 family protein [Methylomonas sp. 2BW1-5-20]|uniref:DUF7079 family protein n=1 Tax=Methylomonas sp. 2BW1-5-20 TaxID=3376686 RepID=UPI004050201A